MAQAPPWSASGSALSLPLSLPPSSLSSSPPLSPVAGGEWPSGGTRLAGCALELPKLGDALYDVRGLCVAKRRQSTAGAAAASLAVSAC